MALASTSLLPHLLRRRSPPSLFTKKPPSATVAMVADTSSISSRSAPPPPPPPSFKTVDSHLHVWASPQEAAERYPYFPGQEPAICGDTEVLLKAFLLFLQVSMISFPPIDDSMVSRRKNGVDSTKCMVEAGVDGGLIVQPINHMFDHSLVTSVLKKYPSKFIGCCLANPAEDGSGIKQLEDLVQKDGYRAVRFNPSLWPSGQKMTNEIGKGMFSKAGELGVPVGIMCMNGLNSHISEIVELCSTFPSTVVLLDHMAFCKPPVTEEETKTFTELLKLSRFPEVYVKFSALFRLSRTSFPYEDTLGLLSQVVFSFGAKRVMWGSDFPFVVAECGYKEAKEACYRIANQLPLPSNAEWIMGRTATTLFQGSWADE